MEIIVSQFNALDRGIDLPELTLSTLECMNLLFASDFLGLDSIIKASILD